MILFFLNSNLTLFLSTFNHSQYFFTFSAAGKIKKSNRRKNVKGEAKKLTDTFVKFFAPLHFFGFDILKSPAKEKELFNT